MHEYLAPELVSGYGHKESTLRNIASSNKEVRFFHVAERENEEGMEKARDLIERLLGAVATSAGGEERKVTARDAREEARCYAYGWRINRNCKEPKVSTLEGELGDKPYFGGETFGFLELVLITTYSRASKMFGKFSIGEQCPKIIAWAESIGLYFQFAWKYILLFLIYGVTGDLPYYKGIINVDIDIDSPLLGTSQNNPMPVSDSPPQVENAPST
ncbi:putative glutathione s-transferase [Quercus suber]|uniref:Glutathione s-transferase n=1 Tax=Quercus suber TaxID=58331 RepID=A0AAW0LL19_QUESU